MASFKGHQSTVVGQQLIAKLMATEKPLVYTSVKVGEGVLGGVLISTMTALIKERLSFDIVETPVKVGAGQWNVTAVFTNRELSSPMWFREWGIFALDPDTGGEVLLCYSNSGETAGQIPPWSGESSSGYVEERLTCTCKVAVGMEVTGVTIDSSQIYVEKEVFEQYQEEIASGALVVGNSHRLEGYTLADILPKQMVLEIDSTGWVGTAPPFTKEIPIAAITAEDTPIIGLVTPKVTVANIDMVRGLHVAYGVMTIWETFGGKMVITCLEEKPEVAITVQLDFAGARNLTTRAYGASGGGELVLGISADTAYRGDRGHIAYEHSNSGDNPHNVTPQIIGAVDATNEIQPEEVAGAFD